MKSIIPGTEIEVLLLQYGSAFFEADDTDESDFDILMVTKYSEIEKFMQREYRSHVFEVAEMRSQFFFGKFFAELVTEPEVEVYAADRARIPQIKLIVANELHVDISFAVVSNREFKRDQLLILGNNLVT